MSDLGTSRTRGDQRSVAIIGGGLAGLSAAETIGRANQNPGQTAAGSSGNVRVTLFEAKRFTGGRAGSFTMPDGRQADYCQHVAMGCCTELLSLLRRSGLIDDWQRYESMTFLHPDYRPSRFAAAKWLPPPLHLLPTIAAMRYFRAAEKARLIAGLTRLLVAAPENLIDVTAADWLLSHHQTPRIIELFWEPILVSALGESVDKVSMSPARKTIVDGFAASRDAADLWVPRLPLSEMFGRRLTDHVGQLGTTVRTAATVRAVHRRGVEFELEGDGLASDKFDAVIVATPWHRTAGLMGDGLSAVRDAVAPVQSIAGSPITGMHLWFDRPVLRVPHVVMLATHAQWCFAAPVRNADPNYVQVVISSRSKSTDRQTLIDTVCDEIRHIDPSVAAGDLSNATLVDAKVVTDPRSVYSVTPTTERIRPPTTTPCPGLWLAGDIVATGWPATMEGAVRSGRMAAEAVATPPSASRQTANR